MLDRKHRTSSTTSKAKMIDNTNNAIPAEKAVPVPTPDLKEVLYCMDHLPLVTRRIIALIAHNNQSITFDVSSNVTLCKASINNSDPDNFFSPQTHEYIFKGAKI